MSKRTADYYVEGGMTNRAIIPTTGPSDKEADVLRDRILDLPDTLPGNAERVYYISPSGNNENDGRSPEHAWASVDPYMANLDSFGHGDCVLFERGGIYRKPFYLKAQVSYGAYGTGPKPRIYGSPRNYASEDCWVKTDMPDIWRCIETLPDVGVIVFDAGKEVGIRKIHGIEEVKEEYDFYYNPETKELFLKMSKNPAQGYEDIEICIAGCLVSTPERVHDILIENLCLEYGGAHGIATSDGVKRITIRGCIVGWIGGCLQSPTVRFGNGIQFWDTCVDIIIEDCWVFQCYDAGLTHQSNSDRIQQRITYRNNLVEYCVYSFELFMNSRDALMKDDLYENNILRFAGCGWGKQRPNPQAISHINMWQGTFTADNFVIRNNILDQSANYLFVDYARDSSGVQLYGNRYYQGKGRLARWFNDACLTVETQEDMESQVRLMEPQAAEARLI